MLRDSFSVSLQPSIWKPPSHSFMGDVFREFSLTPLVSEHQVNQVCCAVSARRVFVVKAIYRAVRPQHNELRKYIIN